MQDSNAVFDQAMIFELRLAAESAWERLSIEKRQNVTREEIARLVMLMALGGVLDKETIIQSILDQTITQNKE